MNDCEVFWVQGESLQISRPFLLQGCASWQHPRFMQVLEGARKMNLDNLNFSCTNWRSLSISLLELQEVSKPRGAFHCSMSQSEIRLEIC